jgi:hypothetical protein
MKLRATVSDSGYEIRFSDVSTILNVTVHDWGTDSDGEPRTLVELWAIVLRNVPSTPALFEWVARNAGSLTFGKLVMYDEDPPGKMALVFTHTLLGDYLDEAELRTALWAVLSTADKWDDELQQRFGGQRLLDL